MQVKLDGRDVYDCILDSSVRKKVSLLIFWIYRVDALLRVGRVVLCFFPIFSAKLDSVSFSAADQDLEN